MSATYAKRVDAAHVSLTFRLTCSIFLGVVRPLPTSLLSLRAWISPNGVFLCADQQFSSAIGMNEGELVSVIMAAGGRGASACYVAIMAGRALLRSVHNMLSAQRSGR